MSSRKSENLMVESLHFDGLLLSKSCTVSAKKVQKSYEKFKEKLTCSLKHDIRNLMNFHPTTQNSENFTLMGSFCPIFHDTEQWCKIWIKLDLVVSKLAWGIRWTFVKALKNLKICTLMGPFCPKRNVSARKSQRNYVSWHWKVMQNLRENWLVAWEMTRNLVNFHESSWKSENLHLMGSFCRKHIKS